MTDPHEQTLRYCLLLLPTIPKRHRAAFIEKVLEKYEPEQERQKRIGEGWNTKSL
jgi:hypothetical protein